MQDQLNTHEHLLTQARNQLAEQQGMITRLNERVLLLETALNLLISTLTPDSTPKVAQSLEKMKQTLREGETVFTDIDLAQLLAKNESAG